MIKMRSCPASENWSCTNNHCAIECRMVTAAREAEAKGPGYDLSIHTNPDARAWAEFFAKTNPDCGIPQDVMETWFANAMMAMHDHLVYQGRPINGDHAQYLADKAAEA